MSHMTQNAINSWLIGLAISLAATMATAGDTPMQVGRYTIVAPVATAAQADPLQTMVKIRFPNPHITTVGMQCAICCATAVTAWLSPRPPNPPWRHCWITSCPKSIAIWDR